MDNPVRTYDWGSPTALARLRGYPPPGGPEAELWMGAHPAAPSTLLPTEGPPLSLPDLIEADPTRLLGTGLLERFGPRLPYLLKILAIDKPLSVQVHPCAERAAQGFHAPAGAANVHRYGDPWPKPEMLCALEPVEVLCGFRSAADAAGLLGLPTSPRLEQVGQALFGDGTEHTRLETAFTVLITWPDRDRAAFATEVVDSCAELLSRGTVREDAARALRWVVELAELHPQDPLVAAPLLMDLVHLEPGEALFIPAGAPHAYLHGVGVEIQGSSDNVLRAGLTSKDIAVGELLWVVDGRTRPERVDASRLGPTECVWRPPAQEFQLSHLRLDGTATRAAPLPGPQILLCTSGAVTVTVEGGTGVTLTPGTSCFVGAGCPAPTFSGTGEVFRAAVAQGADRET